MVRKVALPEPPTSLLIRDASSPSSADAHDPPSDAVVSRRKRPLESADDPKAAPPAKRDRKDAAPPVHQVARAAWDALSSKEPHRPDFRKDELVAMFARECHRLGLSARAVQRLKRQLAKFVRMGMFQKSPRPNAPQDSFIMVNPDYKHLRSRDAQRRGDAPKKADHGSGGSNAGDDAVIQEVPSRATVPTEWTAEAYKPVKLSAFDKSHAIRFVGENTVRGLKGYRMIRATTGVSEGDWYFECTIRPYVEGAVRLGWSMRRCDVETPVGFDAYGFGLRDRSGEFVHMARRKAYGQPFQPGDVIGCRIILPALTDEERKAVADAEQRWLHYRFVSYAQGQAPADSGIDITSRAKIEFFKNGKSMGIPSLFNAPKSPPARAAEEESNVEISNGSTGSKESVKTTAQADGEVKKCMKAGIYYPSVALFQDAIVQANFGPEFKYGLPEGSRPMCGAAKDKPVTEDSVEKPAGGTEKTVEGERKSEPASDVPLDAVRRMREEVTKAEEYDVRTGSSEETGESRDQAASFRDPSVRDRNHPVDHTSNAPRHMGKAEASMKGAEGIERNAGEGNSSGLEGEEAAVDAMPVPVISVEDVL